MDGKIKLCRMFTVLMILAVLAGCANTAEPVVSETNISESDVSGSDDYIIMTAGDRDTYIEPFVPTVSFAFTNHNCDIRKKPLQIVGVNPDGSKTFDRTFSDYYCNPLAYAEMPDGGLAIVVVSKVSMNHTGVFGDSKVTYNYPLECELIRLDKDGNILWKYPFVRDTDMGVSDTDDDVELEDIDYIVVSPGGDIYTVGGGMYDLYLKRFSPDGTLVESKTIDGYLDLLLRSLDVLFSPRGELIVRAHWGLNDSWGCKESYDVYYAGKTYLTAYNDKLEVVWQSLIMPGYSMGLCGDKIIIGYTIYAPHYDNAGNSNYYDEYGYSYFSLEGKLLETYSGGNRVYKDAVFAQTDGKLFLCRDGKQTLVGQYDTGTYGHIDIAPLSDGRFIVQVVYDEYNKKTKYIYYMYDRNGNPLEYKGLLLPNGAPYPLGKKENQRIGWDGTYVNG